MRILRIFLVALLVSISVSVSGATAQTDWLLYRNVDPRFRFLYPPEWRLGTPRGANVRATLFPTLDAPSANCNVVVRPEPECIKENYRRPVHLGLGIRKSTR